MLSTDINITETM